MKYIPLEDLIDILLADKINYIRDLERRLRELESAMTIPTESEPSGIVSTAIPTKLEEEAFPAPVSIIEGPDSFTYSESVRKMSERRTSSIVSPDKVSFAGMEKVASPVGSVRIMSPIGSGPKISEVSSYEESLL